MTNAFFLMIIIHTPGISIQGHLLHFANITSILRRILYTLKKREKKISIGLRTSHDNKNLLWVS